MPYSVANPDEAPQAQAGKTPAAPRSAFVPHAPSQFPLSPQDIRALREDDPH